MKIPNKILELILTLGNGHHRVVCPVCHGGTTKERSLVLTISPTTARWLCHRASCQIAGTAAMHSQKLKPMQEKCYNEQPQSAYLLHSKKHYQPTTNSEPKGYIKRIIRDSEGNERGAVYRRGPDLPKHYSKDINRIEEGYVGLHFPSRPTSDTVILVEDIPSANAMDEFFPTVALLGVHLSEKKLEYLVNIGIRRVIIALDNDATRQAIRLARRFLITTQVLVLQKDLKDQTKEQLAELASKLKTRYQQHE